MPQLPSTASEGEYVNSKSDVPAISHGTLLTVSSVIKGDRIAMLALDWPLIVKDTILDRGSNSTLRRASLSNRPSGLRNGALSMFLARGQVEARPRRREHRRMPPRQYYLPFSLPLIQILLSTLHQPRRPLRIVLKSNASGSKALLLSSIVLRPPFMTRSRRALVRSLISWT